ncbi:unnamed protein product, partial [Polarella glacialis]
DDAGSGIVGIISRRDLLSYLDLAMLSAARRADGTDGPTADSVQFNVATPLKAMLETLSKFRHPAAEEAKDAQSNSFTGADLAFEKELPVNKLVLRVLGAENRKLFFVQ